MRINVDLCGEKLIDWKVDCDNYLPNNEQHFWTNIPFDGETGFGKERILALDKKVYAYYDEVGSWVRNWTDTIAVTR